MKFLRKDVIAKAGVGPFGAKLDIKSLKASDQKERIGSEPERGPVIGCKNPDNQIRVEVRSHVWFTGLPYRLSDRHSSGIIALINEWSKPVPTIVHSEC